MVVLGKKRTVFNNNLRKRCSLLETLITMYGRSGPSMSYNLSTVFFDPGYPIVSKLPRNTSPEWVGRNSVSPAFKEETSWEYRRTFDRLFGYSGALFEGVHDGKSVGYTTEDPKGFPKWLPEGSAKGFPK